MPLVAENLFDGIEGLRSEDLVTETLAFILRTPEYEPLQKIFYEFLLKDQKWGGTLGRQIEVRTQVNLQGRIPDIVLRSDDVYIVVENKFTAEFSGNDQLARYLKILTEAESGKKHLVLLCPRYAWERYEFQTLNQFKAQYPSLTSFEDLARRLHEDAQVEFTPVCWDELLDLLDSESPIIASFSSFVRKRFLRPVHFTEEQRGLLMNIEIPETLERIITTVERVRGHLTSSEIQTGRFGQAARHYGFSIKKDGYEFWFGYILGTWGEFKTPFFVQCRNQWGEQNHQLTDDTLEAAGFRQHELSDFVLPLSFSDSSEEIAGELAVGVMEAVDTLVPTSSAN